jgi:succinyl-CoA synthetase beta subunit
MKVHEYQAKELFSSFSIPVPAGNVVSTPSEASKVASAFSGPVVVKAQIYAGGRGKAGGVKIVDSAQEAGHFAEKILNYPLVTHQTGPEGRVVHRVLIEEATKVKTEIYLGITIDRYRRLPVIMASPAGGMEIEQIAKDFPDRIFKEWVWPEIGLRAFQCYRLAVKLGLSTQATSQVAKIINNLYRLFLDKDCMLVEINPLVVDFEDDVIALDAKINFDDNGIFRHPEIEKLQDPNEENPLESQAKKNHLNYIKLDGNVGCLVNGAGLAMATMDLIKLAGATPANFLDVGGSANEEMIEKGFSLLLSDPDVRAVFINIFGGILRCDILARGIVAAVKRLQVQVPVIVRLEGTNVEEGRDILAQSGLEFLRASDLDEAATLVAQALGGEKNEHLS